MSTASPRRCPSCREALDVSLANHSPACPGIALDDPRRGRAAALAAEYDRRDRRRAAWGLGWRAYAGKDTVFHGTTLGLTCPIRGCRHGEPLGFGVFRRSAYRC